VLKIIPTALLALLAFPLTAAVAVEPPTPLQPIPTDRQLAWHELEYYGFLHFTMNTFTDMEWGYGDEDPAQFNPTELDVTQWVRVAKDAGMTALIITAKHHDGFCLWPSDYTEHSIKHSPYKDGNGDIVGDLAAACKDAGLKFGVYLSPWDRNHPEYGRPAYIEYFRNQLRELLTNYGEIAEVWFDGANGGDGYYGGAREERKIDHTTYYDWENTWAIVRELQPGAVLFSDVGPDIRWVGNEKGFAGDPCWATYTPHAREEGGTPAPGLVKYKEGVNGHADGEFWLPAEVDVSIRPGWFYHADQNDKVRSAENLMELYYQSVGRGASLLLNLPPDPRGLIHENDVASLMGFRKIRDGIFTDNLAKGAFATSDDTRGEDVAFGAGNVLDSDGDTYWTTDDSVTSAAIVLALDGEKTFDHVVLQEYIPLGQRIRKFSVEAWVDGAWAPVAEGTSIGWKRILKFDPVKAAKVRVNVLEAAACPALASVSVHGSPGL